MASSSSSTKRAARLAERGRGQRVRFQGGTLFPFIVALIFVLGTALVIYARQSRPAADASAPTIDDHWHHTYGFFLCDEWVQVTGAAEERTTTGQLANTNYLRSGIHSHDDGLIHWHPFSSASVGRRAQLGVFLDTYGVELTDEKLEFPEEQRAQLPEQFRETGVIEEGESKCTVDGEEVDAQLQAVRWNNISDTDDARTTFIAGMDKVALDRDAMVIVVAFAPDGVDIVKPPWNTEFDQNVTNDTNQQRPNDSLTPGADANGESEGDSETETTEPADEDATETTEPDADSDEETSTTEAPASDDEAAEDS